MKRLTKILAILFISLLVLSGCGKKKEKVVEDPTPIDVNPITDVEETKKEVDLTEKVTVEDIGFVDGEKGAKYSVLKVMNRNSVPASVTVTIKYNTGDTEDVTVIAGSNKYVYVVGKKAGTNENIESYEYTFNIKKEEFEDYNSVYSAIVLNCSNSGTNLIMTIENNSMRKINANVIMFFYKDGNMVALKEITETGIMSTDVKKDVVEFPLKNDTEKIPFDKVSVLLNEIHNEL